jgi:hypothetical protein
MSHTCSSTFKGKQLLAALGERSSRAMPAERQLVGNSKAKTCLVRVHAIGFAWTLSSPADGILGRGTADTELSARIAAFQAGMISERRKN